MKRQLFFMFIWGILLNSYLVSNAQNTKRASVKDAQEDIEVGYNGIFSDDKFANAGLMGAFLGLEQSPNPYAHLKGKLVTLKLRFNEDFSETSLIISMKGKTQIDTNFSNAFHWNDKDKRLTLKGKNYILVVETQSEKLIGLIQLKNGKIAHRWDIKPQSNNITWFNTTLKYAYVTMSYLSILESAFKDNKWATMIASYEKNFPDILSTAKKIREDLLKELQAKAKKKPSSVTTKQKINDNNENNVVNSMLSRARAYHEGKTTDKTPNDLQAYYWYMKAYHALPQKSADAVMEEIIQTFVPKEILDKRHDKSSYLSQKKEKVYISSDNKYLNTSELSPFDLALHPIGFLPTNMWPSRLSKKKKECEKYKGWKVDGSKYLNIYSYENKLPSLYGRTMETINFSTNRFDQFEYTFEFDTYEEAERFLYLYTFDYLKKGIVFTNNIEAIKGETMDDSISLSSNFYSYIDNKVFNINNYCCPIKIGID